MLGKTYHTGRVVRINPILDGVKLRDGSTVITPRGLGVVRKPDKDAWSSGRVEVYLNRNYHKTFYLKELFQYAVYHKPSDQLVLLSPLCYDFIAEKEQPVRYRLTNRSYAYLTDDYKQEHEHYAYMNKQRGGPTILRVLLEKKYVFLKKKKRPNWLQRIVSWFKNIVLL